MRDAFIATLFFLSGAAFAQSADVGLVNLVQGEVGYAPRGGAHGNVNAFMRVRDGDRFELPAGTQLRVVYFDGARQERWQGPASFRAGKTSGEHIAGAAAEIVILPVGVPQRIARVPELVQNAKLGGIQLRGGVAQPRPDKEIQMTLLEARAAYDEMRQRLPADDITPELFLYAALYDYQMYDDMKPVVAEMRRKQPASEDAKSLESWLQRRTGQ